MSWHQNALQHAFAFERVLVTPYTFTTIYIPAALSYYVMAVLVQLPRTGAYRTALLPVALWLMFRASMLLDFSWNPFLAHFNQALSITMFVSAIRTTKWALAQQPYTRLSIHKLGIAATSDQGGDTPIVIKPSVPVFLAMWNACDLAVNFRGIGWNGPEKVHTPAPYFQVDSRFAFVIISLFQSTVLALVFCAMCGIIHSLIRLQTFGTPKCGIIFDPSLPPVERYTKSSIVTLLSGIAVYAFVNASYQLYAALFVTVFRQHPAQWPPFFDSPWLSTSLASFWGRRWHQALRECFVEAGSKPMGKLFGRVGIIMGAFAVSGILHDIGAPVIARGWSRGSLQTVGFFLLQGVGVTMEYVWRRATGRRVGGFVGWLWVFTWMILSGHIIVDLWLRTVLTEFALHPFPSFFRVGYTHQ